MKKTLIIIFTVFVIGILVFTVFAADNTYDSENTVKNSENTSEDISVFSEEITTGTAEAKKRIGIDTAKIAAAEYVGAEIENVIFTEKEIDRNFSGFVYELELCYEGTEYECNVNAYSGKVTMCKNEPCEKEYHTHVEHHIKDETINHGSHHSAVQNEIISEPATENAVSEEITTQNSVEKNDEKVYSYEDAKAAALEFVGLRTDDVVFTEISRDFDDGRFICELSFCSNGTEYECEVDMNSGKVVDLEKSGCDEHYHSHSGRHHYKEHH